MRTCPRCGLNNIDDARFCAECGTELPGATPAAHIPAAPYTMQQPQPAVYGGSRYVVEGSNKTLRLIAFIFCIVGCVATAINALAMMLGDPIGIIAFIAYAWRIPMTVIAWGIYKGEKKNTIAFGVCTLIFVDVVAGILLLVAKKDK